MTVDECGQHLGADELLTAIVDGSKHPFVIGVERVVFGAPDPKAGACGSLYQVGLDTRLNHTFELRGGLLEAECAELLHDFFRDRRD